jgi:FkbM family methyltransferase
MLNIKKNQSILVRRQKTILRNGEAASIEMQEERILSLSRGFMGIIPLKCDLGSFFYLDLNDDIVARHLLALGAFGYERGSAAAWTILAREAALVIDIGAFTGYFTLLAAKLANAKNIIAVEANPLNYQRLRENMNINNVSALAINKALVPAESQENGNGYIEIKYNSKLSSLDAGGFANHAKAHLIAAKSTKQDTYQIDTVTINSLLKDNAMQHKQEQLLLAKVDVEGLEEELLNGFLEAKKTNFVVIIELLNEEGFNNIKHILSSQSVDYSIFFIDEGALRIRDVGLAKYREFKRKGSRNFIICSADKKQHIATLNLSDFLRVAE